MFNELIIYQKCLYCCTLKRKNAIYLTFRKPPTVVERNPQATQQFSTYPSLQPPISTYPGYMQQHFRMPSHGLIASRAIQPGMFQPYHTPRMSTMPNYNSNPVFQVGTASRLSICKFSN